MMKFKKITLSLGSIAAIAAPVAAVVSCGTSTQYSEEDLLRMSNLKSTEGHTKIQALWLSKVLLNEYGIKNVTPYDLLINLSNSETTKGSESQFEKDFKETLTWVLKNKLFASKDALSEVYKSVKATAPDTVLESKPGVQKDIITNLGKKVFDRSDIDTKVDTVMNDTEWKNIFYNYSFVDDDKDKDILFNPSALGIKDTILKMMVTKKYLSKTSSEFSKALPSENNNLAAEYKDADLIDPTAKNFPLVVSVMKARLAYKTSINIDASKSRQFIFANTDNKLAVADVENVFSLSSSKFKVGLPFSATEQTIVGSILAKKPTTSVTDTIGFQGISSLPSGSDTLSTSTVASIKLANTMGDRDGFVVDSKLLTKADVDKDDAALTEIRFTDKDKTKVELDYYTSLMPAYDATDNTLELKDLDADHLDLLMDEIYSKDTSLYSTAIKYFTEKEDPIKIKISNDWARKYYIDEGLTYVDDEK